MRITCPECETVLRPAKPIAPGKKVKCPKCGSTFEVPEASGDESSEEDGVTRAPAAIKNKAGARAPAPKKVAKQPEKKPTPGADDDDDEGGTYSLAGGGGAGAEEEEAKPDINYAPDTSIKDLRGPAQAAVIKPTNMLIGFGVVGFIGYLVLFIYFAIPVLFPIELDEGTKDFPKAVLKIDRGLGRAGVEGFGGAAGKSEATKDKANVSLYQFQGLDLGGIALFEWYMFLVMMLPLFLGMAYASVQTYGIVKAQNLESRNWGVVASIMAMIPISFSGFGSVVILFVNFLMNMFMDDNDWIARLLIGNATILVLAQICAAVYCLRTLMRPEVIAGFEFVPDTEDVKAKKKDKSRRKKSE